MILFLADYNECSQVGICQNGGRCINTQGAYQCQCMSGWTGDNCEIDINECISAPCMNGGTCQNTLGSYMCTCQAGFTGNNCETGKYIL